MTWNDYEVRVTVSGQPRTGENLGPEFVGDGTARIDVTVRATSRQHALRKAMYRHPNAVEAEILEVS